MHRNCLNKSGAETLSSYGQTLAAAAMATRQTTAMLVIGRLRCRCDLVYKANADFSCHCLTSSGHDEEDTVENTKELNVCVKG